MRFNQASTSRLRTSSISRSISAAACLPSSISLSRGIEDFWILTSFCLAIFWPGASSGTASRTMSTRRFIKPPDRADSGKARPFSASLLLGVEPLFDRFPVDRVPPSGDIFRAAVLILEIVGMLPDINSKYRELAFHDRAVLIWRRGDRQG